MEDLKKSKGLTVTCVVDGTAYSMAAVILESPLCDKRLATRRSTILFHNGSVQASGTAQEIHATEVFLEALNEAMVLVVSERLGCTPAEYAERIALKDWIMSVHGAMDANVIDGVVNAADIAPPAGG
jgi:ATP-dependent protease ClpP protease subunit